MRQSSQSTFLRIVTQIQGEDHPAGTLRKQLCVPNTTGRNTCSAALVGTVSTVLHLGGPPFDGGRWRIQFCLWIVHCLNGNPQVAKQLLFGNAKHQWFSPSHYSVQSPNWSAPPVPCCTGGFQCCKESINKALFGPPCITVPKCILLSVEACTLSPTSQNDKNKIHTY